MNKSQYNVTKSAEQKIENSLEFNGNRNIFHYLDNVILNVETNIETTFELNLSFRHLSFEEASFLKNLFQMTEICFFGISKKDETLNSVRKHFVDMSGYISKEIADELLTQYSF